jgi:epoxyqueuosine reductase QueG
MVGKQDIVGLIARVVAEWTDDGEVASRWRDPLVGVAAANDPLFARLNEAVRPSHARPTDLLPGARSVVAFFLPFEPRIGASNRHGRHGSTEWARAYVETNRLVAAICQRVAEQLEARGERVHVTPATRNYDPEALVSDWSHRHVAHIAGLGTFGLNNMLITERGCCGRLGSLITSAALEPDGRPSGERCLHKRDGSCGICVERCVNEALTVDGFDRWRCREMLLENGRIHAALGLADVCGKCVVKLPCSHVAPRAKRRS